MKKYIALVLAAVLVLGIFTGCGNKGNKETESQTDEKATESVNSTENNTEGWTTKENENHLESCFDGKFRDIDYMKRFRIDAKARRKL